MYLDTISHFVSDEAVVLQLHSLCGEKVANGPVMVGKVVVDGQLCTA